MSVTSVRGQDEAKRFASGNQHAPLVVVPIYNAYDDVIACVEALLRYSPDGADLLLIDDGSSDGRVPQFLRELEAPRHSVATWFHDDNRGFVIRANEAFNAGDRRDVVLVNSDVIVGPNWLDRLAHAAASDDRIATISTLTNHGTMLSVPYRNSPGSLPADVDPNEAANAVGEGSLHLLPQIPTPVGHCLYVRRAALDLVGTFDTTFGTGYGEEVDFGQRCVGRGLKHIVADDVFVFHRGGGSFGRSGQITAQQQKHEQELGERYPYYHQWIRDMSATTLSPLSVALQRASSALTGLTIGVDATCLGSVIMGTQRVTIETIRALARSSRVDNVIVLTNPRASKSIGNLFKGMPRLRIQGITTPNTDLAVDLIYRPYQVNSYAELETLKSIAGRTVISHLDFIAYNNPRYFESYRLWEDYRDLTRLSLASVDGVAFLSNHARLEAYTEGLLRKDVPAETVYAGTDHLHEEFFLSMASRRSAARRLVTTLGDTPYVVVLGTDYLHKNRLFALKVYGAMRASGYRGHLVLVGPAVNYGSSRPEEAQFLLSHPELAPQVHVLRSVSEQDKNAILKGAQLVLHPTLYEGFGMVPFESALAGVPCLTSATTSLEEILPAEMEVIADWQAEAVAQQALAIISDHARRLSLVDSLVERASRFTWDAVIERTITLFDRVLSEPKSTVAAVTTDGGATVSYANVATWERRRSPELDPAYPPAFREALRAIWSRPLLRRPFVWIISSMYRLSAGLRRIGTRKHRRGSLQDRYEP